MTKPLSACAYVCLDLFLLPVRWVSVKRIITVSLLYPHTLSQRPTFTRPTFPCHPTPRPPLCLMLPGNKLGFYLKRETQSSKFSDSDSVVEAGLTWSPCVFLLHFHPPLLIKWHYKYLKKVFYFFLNSHYQK